MEAPRKTVGDPSLTMTAVFFSTAVSHSACQCALSRACKPIQPQDRRRRGGFSGQPVLYMAEQLDTSSLETLRWGSGGVVECRLNGLQVSKNF
jgi:hypothetical protein